VRLGMHVNYAGDILGTIEEVARYEARGLDVAFVAEAYGFDAVSLLGYLAAKTERLTLASGILPLYSRTPALIAQTAAGLDYVSGGRFALGLGASGPQVIEGWHGVAYDKPLARTREIVEICRRVWARERLVNEGCYEIPLRGGTGLGKPLKLITHPVRERIPIYLAALGPANVALTAEIAEGWLPIFYWPERAEAVFGASLAKGRARRDPSLGPLEVVAGGLLAIGDDAEEVLEAARVHLALYVGGMGAKGKNFYHELFCRYGLQDMADEVQDRYLSGDRDGAVDAIPLEVVANLHFVGDHAFVAKQLRSFAAGGVTTLLVDPAGRDPEGSFFALREMLDGR